VKSALLISLLAALTACEPKSHGSSSASVADARRAGVLTAEYVVPNNADLGRYRPIEVWIEHGNRLVVRLKGPHVDTEPRVRVQGLADTDLSRHLVRAQRPALRSLGGSESFARHARSGAGLYEDRTPQANQMTPNAPVDRS
jgi:hypothetical protein